MNPTMLMAIGQGVSAVGTLLGGIGAQRQAQLDAFNVGTEAILARTQAIQQTLRRNEQLKEAIDSFDAYYMSVLGREETADIRAFERKEEETTGDDISDIEMMDRLNQLKYKGEAAGIRRKGHESLISAVIQAGSTALGAYADYKALSGGLITPRSEWQRPSGTSIRPRLRG